MGIVNDLVDPYYRSRAKNKIKALEAKIESYKIQCEIYEEEIDQLNNAKVFSLKVVKDMEIYINSIGDIAAAPFYRPESTSPLALKARLKQSSQAKPEQSAIKQLKLKCCPAQNNKINQPVRKK